MPQINMLLVSVVPVGDIASGRDGRTGLQKLSAVDKLALTDFFNSLLSVQLSHLFQPVYQDIYD